MAAAASSSALASSEEKTNGAKLSRLLIDGGTTVLRSVFDSYHPPANLAADLNASYSILNKLLRRRILNGHQWDKLFPPSGAAPDSNTFDITLLFLLVTNICRLSPPLSGWHSKPPAGDTSHEANLARIKFFRNQLYGHVAATGVDTPTFNALWQEISAVLVALGLGQAEIDRLKAERGGEEDYLDALRDWAESEEDIKTQLKDMRHVQTSTQQTVEGNKSKLEEIHQIEKKTHEVVTNVYRDQQEDRSSIQKSFSKLDQDVLELHCEVSEANVKMSQTVEGNKCKLEEVCQVVTEIRQTQVNQDHEDEIVLKKLAKVDTQNDVRYYSERYLERTRQSIFVKVDSWLKDRNSPNRVMVISGNAGMGKSVIAAEMCKRMQEAGKLSGSHFCHHDKARHRNPKVMLQSLATHLSCCLPEYRNNLVTQLSRNLVLDINDMEVADLFELLFELPLRNLKNPGFNSLVVIDALDESEYQGRNDLVDVIAKYFNKLPLWIRFLVTTRPEIDIVEKLKSLQPLLLEPNDEENLKDIRIYFEHQLSHMLHAEHHDLILEDLVQKSDGVILCAQFLVDFVKKNFSILTLEQLDSTLPSGISSVYQSYFKRLETELCKELRITEDQFFSFLSAITVSREPLPLGFVSKLLFLGTLSPAVQRKVNQAISCISSLFPVHDGCINFFHKSVKDWLTDEAFYGQHNFNVNKSEGHRILSRLCIDEFDDIKRKGVDASQSFRDTTKYALQHGVQHMLQVNEDARSYSLDEVATNYVLDIELVYAKLCVNSRTASDDILCVTKKQKGLNPLSVEMQNALGTFLFLLRKHKTTLEELSSTIFQTLLNEGGPGLSSEASKLLGAKYSNLSYLEYLNKNDLRGAVQTTFYCSSKVACFDVSPQSDYMVCECRDGTIQLWSLHTGQLIWKRPVFKMKRYLGYLAAIRLSRQNLFSLTRFQIDTSSLSYFRSVVFHPTEDVILPGVLSHAYSFDGNVNRLFPESKCSFTVCSISGDEILTDCPDDAKCLIMWSLTDGREISRLTRDEDVLSFAWSKDRRLLAISHSSGSVCSVDVMNGFRTLAETTVSNACGMIKFSPDYRFLFCRHLTELGRRSMSLWEDCLFCLSINMENHDTFSLDVSSKSVSYEPWKFEARTEGGFALGDPICCSPGRVSIGEPSVAFVLNQHSVLRSYPSRSDITMFSLDGLTNGRDIYGRNTTIVNNLVFSINGETVFVVSQNTAEGGKLTAWDVSTAEPKGSKSKLSKVECLFCPVAVRQGILLRSSLNTVELWDFELSRCIRLWELGGSRVLEELIPISDERVVCTELDQAIILDTSSKVGVTATKRFSGKLVACSGKCQLITFDGSILRSVQGAVWEKPFFPLNSTLPRGSLLGLFSPTEEFLLISDSYELIEYTLGVYVLDASSGNTRHILCQGQKVMDYKFVSDEACVIHTYHPASGFRLQMFNVRSGDLLSLLDIDLEKGVQALGSCPRKGLIAIGGKDTELKFKVILVKLPGTTKDNRKNKRLALIHDKETILYFLGKMPSSKCMPPLIGGAGVHLSSSIYI